jgi:asparagine synthase (glutamine-hydrolysing)
MLDPSRNVLFLSRDRFGIKPLYYWSANGTFCFASEIKALRAVPGVDPEPDRGVVAKYIPTGVVDDTERTFFAGVLQLPPAHNLNVSLDGSLDEGPWRYWAPPEAMATNQPPTPSSVFAPR